MSTLLDIGSVELMRISIVAAKSFSNSTAGDIHRHVFSIATNLSLVGCPVLPQSETKILPPAMMAPLKSISTLKSLKLAICEAAVTGKPMASERIVSYVSISLSAPECNESPKKCA